MLCFTPPLLFFGLVGSFGKYVLLKKIHSFSLFDNPISHYLSLQNVFRQFSFDDFIVSLKFFERNIHVII